MANTNISDVCSNTTAILFITLFFKSYDADVFCNLPPVAEFTITLLAVQGTSDFILLLFRNPCLDLRGWVLTGRVVLHDI